MIWKAMQHDIRLILAVSCALTLMCSGVALADTSWVDEVWNMVMFEKAS